MRRVNNVASRGSKDGMAGGVDLEYANAVVLAAGSKQQEFAPDLGRGKLSQTVELERTVIGNVIGKVQAPVGGNHKSAEAVIVETAGENIIDPRDLDRGDRAGPGEIENAVIVDVIHIRQRAVCGDIEHADAIVDR